MGQLKEHERARVGFEQKGFYELVDFLPCFGMRSVCLGEIFGCGHEDFTDLSPEVFIDFFSLVFENRNRNASVSNFIG